MSPVFSRSKVLLSKILKVKINNSFFNPNFIFNSFPLGIFTKLSTFVLVSFLLAAQIGGQTGNLISPLFQQKSAISNLLRTLGLENRIKASAQAVSPTYFLIQSTDSTGTGFKLSTADAVGTENSSVNFSSSAVTDQQRWYFDIPTKLIKSAISNKCLATSSNQVYNPIIIKTCNPSDNTQVWDITGDVFKNIFTAKCVNVPWSQIAGTTNYENRWFDGRTMQLDNGCGYGIKFVPLPATVSTSSSSSSIIASTVASSSLITNSSISSINSISSASTQQYFSIDTLDTTGNGYRLATSDQAGTENSSVKFTNSTTINDQQRWYFDAGSKQIKSAIDNKCLATTNNQLWNPIIIKSCNLSDNTQIWDITGNVIKNLFTGKCAAAAWSQIGTTGTYENKWFEGRMLNLDDGCYWTYKFNLLPTSNQVSSSSIIKSSLSNSVDSSSNILSSLNTISSVAPSLQYFSIDTLDTTGNGYRLATSDQAGTENSAVKFTNSTTINDQQRWYFDTGSKQIKSALVNKCLATTNNLVWNPIVVKSCNIGDNTQIWDTTGNVIKNLATGNCVSAQWSQIGTTGQYENRWFEGRAMNLDTSCYWTYQFKPLAGPTQTSSSAVSSITNSASSINSSSISSSSFVSINQPIVLTYQENGINLTVAVACTDDGEMVSGQQSFSMVVQYTNNGGRVELVNSRLIPDRLVIHTHFDRKDKDTLNYSDANISTKLSGPVTYVKPAVNGIPAVEPRAMIIQGLGSETVSWKFNILDATGNPIKNAAGLPRDFEVATDRNFATKCAKPTVKIVDTTNPPVNTIDPKYVLPDYCPDTSVTSSVSSSSLAVVSSSLSLTSSVTSTSSAPACIPNPSQGSLNTPVNLRFKFDKADAGPNWTNVAGNSVINLFDSITNYDGKYALALDADPEFEDELDFTIDPINFPNGKPTGRKTTTVKAGVNLDGAFVKWFGVTTMARNTDGTKGNDKVSKYWVYDLNTSQIKSAIDGYCLNTVKVAGQSTYNINLKKCSSTTIVDPNQEWDISNNRDQTLNNLAQKSGSLCLANVNSNAGVDVFTNAAGVIMKTGCYDGTTSTVVNVKARANLSNYNLIQKYAQEAVTANKTVLTNTAGNTEFTFSQITNYDGSQVLGVTDQSGRDASEVKFVTANNDKTVQGQFWYYENNSKMIYSDFNNKCLSLKTGQNANTSPAATASQAGIILQTCNSLDNRQKWMFYQLPNQSPMPGYYNLYNFAGVLATPAPTFFAGNDAGNAAKYYCLGTDDLTSTRYNGSQLSTQTCNPSVQISKQGFQFNMTARLNTSPIISKSIPLISMISKMDTNGKKWKLDVANGLVGEGSKLQVWESFDENTNQMYAYNTETNEIYYNPNKNSTPTTDRVKVTVPIETVVPASTVNGVTAPARVTTTFNEIEVPSWVNKPIKSLYCLSNTGKIQVFTCDGGAYQKWDFSYFNGDIEKPIVKSLGEQSCIDVTDTIGWLNWQSTFNGGNVWMTRCNGSIQQLFQFKEVGKLLAKVEDKTKSLLDNALASFDSVKANAQNYQAQYYISSFFNPNYVLDVSGNGTNNGTDVNIYLRNGGNSNGAQKWILTDKGEIRSQTSNKCLDSNGMAPLQRLYIWECTGGINQKWTIYSDGSIGLARDNGKPSNQSMCMSLQTNSYNYQNSIPVIINYCDWSNCSNFWNAEQNSYPNIRITGTPCTKTPEPLINGNPQPTPAPYVPPYIPPAPTPQPQPTPTPQPTTSGNFKISNLFNRGLVMDVVGGGTADQTKVQAYSDIGSLGQRWTWDTSNLSIKGLAGKCLDSGSGAPGEFLRINECTGRNNQKWAINKDYGITQNGLCIRTSNASAANGNILVLGVCQIDACSTYWDYQDNGATGSYVPSLVQTKACGTFSSGNYTYGSTPQPTNTSTTQPPAPAPTTQAPYVPPQTYTGSNGSGVISNFDNQNDLGGERDYDKEATISPIAINSTNYSAVVTESSDSVFSLAKQIANENYQQFNAEILSGLTSCPTTGITCLANNSYRSALNNSLVAIYRLLVGIFKGLGRVFMDFVSFFFQFGQDAVKNGLPAMFINFLYTAGSALFNIPSIVKSLIPTGKNISDYRAMSYFDKMEHHGYHTAIIGATVYAAYQTVESLINVTPGIVAAIKTSVLGNKNIAPVMVGVEVTTGLVVRQQGSSQVFKATELASQSIDDVGRYAPSAVADMQTLRIIKGLPTKISELKNLDKPIGIDTKLTGYSLNINSLKPEAVGKAKGFRDELGITLSNKNILADQLALSLKNQNYKIINYNLQKYGFKFTIDSNVTGANGITKNVRSSWQFDSGLDPNFPYTGSPRLITTYLKF
jgi:Ricin-type beta-trefoil lectin domain